MSLRGCSVGSKWLLDDLYSFSKCPYAQNVSSNTRIAAMQSGENIVFSERMWPFS